MIFNPGVCRYWTDNGACYYYTTGSKYTNYEDLLVAVKKDADDSGLPFRYVQVNYNNRLHGMPSFQLYSTENCND